MADIDRDIDRTSRAAHDRDEEDADADDDCLDVDQLLATHGKDLLIRARRLLGPDDAEDVLQDVALSLMEAPHMLAGVERVGAWLMTLVTRRCIDLIRRNRRRREQLALMDDEAADDGSPDEPLEVNELLDGMATGLADLPAPLREVLIANVLHERPFRVIAEQTGTPMGTLMARKQKAVRLLREHLSRRGLMPP